MSVLSRSGRDFVVPAGQSRALDDRATAYLLAFIVLQITCQVALFVPGLGAFRSLSRVVAYATSLALLVVVPGRGTPHPAYVWAVASVAIVALGLFHPNTSPLAGLAQTGMYLAVLAPLFWVTRLPVTAAALRRVLLLLWAFHTTSAVFGVVQVYYPGRFHPNVSQVVTGMGTYFEGLKITLSNGSRVWRPMGLTDVPGGAATGGLYALLFGIGFFLSSPRPLARLTAVGSMTVGLFCIYLSQTRSILVMAAVCVLTFAGVALRRGDVGRLFLVTAVVPAVFVVSFAWAALVGGEAVTNRVGTLAAGPAGQVYYKNRGIFLEYTVRELLPRYPLGAGVGRWGMMHYYFGTGAAAPKDDVYAEIQWTGWLLDGGVPLVVTYSLALAAAVAAAYRITLARSPGALTTWAAVILAYDLGAVAITFNSPLFMSQMGVEFWLLNACLFVAARDCFLAVRARPARLPETVAPSGPGVSPRPLPSVPA
jgi:hypothetical protein